MRSCFAQTGYELGTPVAIVPAYDLKRSSSLFNTTRDNWQQRQTTTAAVRVVHATTTHSLVPGVREGQVYEFVGLTKRTSGRIPRRKYRKQHKLPAHNHFTGSVSMLKIV